MAALMTWVRHAYKAAMAIESANLNSWSGLCALPNESHTFPHGRSYAPQA